MTKRKSIIFGLFLCIILIIVFGVFFYMPYRMFSPVPRLVEDSNSITADMLGHFDNLNIKLPQKLSKVFGYDSRQLFADEYLRFTIPDDNEYSQFNSQMKAQGLQASPFPANISSKDMKTIHRWWTPPMKNTFMTGSYYLGFDDYNRTIYLLYKCPD